MHCMLCSIELGNESAFSVNLVAFLRIGRKPDALVLLLAFSILVEELRVRWKDDGVCKLRRGCRWKGEEGPDRRGGRCGRASRVYGRQQGRAFHHRRGRNCFYRGWNTTQR